MISFLLHFYLLETFTASAMADAVN